WRYGMYDTAHGLCCTRMGGSMRGIYGVLIFLFSGFIVPEMIAQEVSFLARQVTRDGQHPNALMAGDFNEDGHMDVAVGNTSDVGDCYVSLWLGNGQGDFQRAAFWPLGRCDVNHPGDVKAGDFNGDGYLDVVVAASGSSDLLMLFGDGQGGLAAPRSLMVGR